MECVFDATLQLRKEIQKGRKDVPLSVHERTKEYQEIGACKTKVIDVKAEMFIPLYGSYSTVQEAREADEMSFKESAYLGAQMGLVSAGWFIVASEMGIHSIAMSKAGQAVVTSLPVSGPIVLAGAVSTVTAVAYEKTVGKQIRKKTKWYGPFSGGLGSVV